MSDPEDEQRPLVLAVDGNSLVHRSFHAQADCGQPDWAVRGLLTQLVAAVERVGPSAVVVGFDDPDRSVRRERWPFYKAQRADKLDTLVAQLAAAGDALRELGVAVVAPAGLEADDVLASAARWASSHGGRTVVVTSDRDAFALIDASTSVLRIINGGVDASPMMTPERLPMLLGVRPEQYRDYAALRGDASDNLPGVRGIGPRLAARVLEHFGSAERAFASPTEVRDRLGPGVARRLGAEGAHAAFRTNSEIMTMRVDIEVTPGPLPLAAEPVTRVFRDHRLVWTLPRARRALAHTDEPAPEPVLPATSEDPRRWASRRSAVPPRLERRSPAAQQLSLF